MARKGWQGKEGKDSEVRTARKGWRGKEGKDGEVRTILQVFFRLFTSFPRNCQIGLGKVLLILAPYFSKMIIGKD